MKKFHFEAVVRYEENEIFAPTFFHALLANFYLAVVEIKKLCSYVYGL